MPGTRRPQVPAPVRLTVLGLLLVVRAAPAAAQGAPNDGPLRTATIAHRALPATVTIIAFGAAGDTIGLGSGFLIQSARAPEGILITNWHVMQGATRAVVVRDGVAPSDRVTFVAGDSATDVAVLKVEGQGFAGLQPTLDIPAVGERVVAIGSPLGLSRTVTEGIVSAIREIEGRTLVQISAAISPGSSGGAILDGAGRVFAIATSYLEGGQQLNFAIPVRTALALIPAVVVERSLASAFSVRGVTRRSGAAGSSDTSEPASAPRASLEGVWAVTQTWEGPGEFGASLQRGVLVVGREVNAFASVTEGRDGERGRPMPSRVRSVRTIHDGEVALTVAGIDMSGYQTDDGFVASGRFVESSRVTYTLRLGATAARIPIGQSTGLYDVRVRTALYEPFSSTPAVAPMTVWIGEMAVVVAGDMIGLGLRLASDRGETIGWEFETGSLQSDGRFLIIADDASLSFSGHVHAGLIQGELRQIRPDGTIARGYLEAERR